METILDIIKKYKSKLHTSHFDGDIYFPDENGKLIIDRTVLNKMLNKFNSQFEEPFLSVNDTFYLSFKYEVFEKSETIWREDRNYYLATIIYPYGIISLWSEETIGYEKKPDVFDFVSWKDIENIEYGESDHFFLRFFIKNKTYHTDLLMNRFGYPKNQKNICTELIYLFKEIIYSIENEEQNNIDEYCNLKSEIENIITEYSNIEKGVKLLEIFRDNYVDINKPDENLDFYYYYKILSIPDTQLAIKAYEEYKLICDKDNIDYDINITNLIGGIYSNNNDYLTAVNKFAYTIENANIESKHALQIESNKVYSLLKKEFSTIDYAKRKLVFIADDILHTTMDGLVVLKKNELPDDILFPLNHPKVNEVYVCHPINKSSYLPLKEFEKELFTDRLHELMLLLGSLGAKKIDISSQEKNRDTQNQSNNTQIDASLNITISSVQGNYENNKKKESSLEHELNIKFHQTLNPKKAPFVPGGLVWYHSNLGWQRLTNQRLNGNLITHTEIISTKQVETLSTNEINKLNAEISLLLGRIKTSVGYTNEMDIKSLTEKNYTLEVTVEFEDIDMLQQTKLIESQLIKNNNTENLDNYKKYAEEVQFMLDDDGIIDEKERRILDRLRKNLELTEEEANDIESKLQITEQNEKEYLDEFIVIMDDGEITEKERRLLDRLAKSLGITEEKVIEIEKKYTKQV